MLKKFLIGLGILFVVFVLVARIAPSFVSEERIKTTVIAKAEELLGHNIQIDGKLRFKIFPIAGVYMEKVTIGKKEQSTESLATFQSMNVDVDTLALINGDVIIKSLRLDKPMIFLAVDKNGKPNWVATKQSKDSVPATTTSSSQPDASSKHIRGLSLEDVRVNNGMVVYHDERNQQKWVAQDVNVSIALDDMDSPFEVDGRLDYNKQTIRFDTTLSTLNSFLQNQQSDIQAVIKSDLLDIEGTGKLDKGSYTGTAKLVSSSVTKAVEWLTQKPLEAKFASALPLKLSSNTACSPDACHFSKAEFDLDSLHATGDVKLLFNRKLPAIETQLETGVLDLNLFMPVPQQAGVSIISSAHAAEGWSTEPIDFSILRRIDLVAGINAAGIKIKDIEIGKTLFRAKIDKGVLSTDMVDAEFYSGKATVIASVDASGATPKVNKRVDFRDIEMEPFLKAAQISDRVAGKTNFKLAVATTGKSESEMMSNLNGNGSMAAKDGNIKGFNVAQMIRNVQSAYKDVDTSNQQTDFSELAGTFTISKGIVSNQDMMMKAPLLRVAGKGTVDLPQQRINYRITPEVVQTAQGQGGKEKTGLGVPVIVTGSLDNPQFRPDLQSTITEAVKDPEKLKATVKDIKQELKENKGAIKNLLKGFGKKEPAPAAGDTAPAAEAPAQ